MGNIRYDSLPIVIDDRFHANARVSRAKQAFIQDFGPGGCWLNPGRVSSDLDPSPSHLGGLVSAVSSPSGVWGGVPAANDFGAFWTKKEALYNFGAIQITIF